MALGSNTQAQDFGATAIGVATIATGQMSTAMGITTNAEGYASTSMGSSTWAVGDFSTSMGLSSRANGKSSTAMGHATQANGENSVALGESTETNGRNAVAMGESTNATGDNAVAMGNSSYAIGATSFAAGDGARATGEYAVSMGYHTVAGARGAFAEGVASEAQGVNSVAMAGGKTGQQATNAFAIGSDAEAVLRDSVALGSGALANRVKGHTGYDANTGSTSTETNESWVATANAVAVGGGQSGDGKLVTRQITGVAAGSEDTDAVNVAQLKTMGIKVNGLDTRITQNTSNIETLDTHVKQNTSTIATLDNKVKQNSDDISTLDTQVKKNTDSIAAVNNYAANVDNRLNRMDTRIDRVGAGAAALAALHPQDFDPNDKWDFAAGYGHYRSANAMAIGAFYRPDARTMLSIGGSMGGGENLVNAGVTFKLGKSSPYAGYSKAALTTVIADQKTTIHKLENQVATQQKQIEAIMRQLAEMKKA